MRAIIFVSILNANDLLSVILGSQMLLILLVLISFTVLTYNRREKMNEGTKEFEDKLTIVLSDGPSQSWAMAGLNPGQKYTTPVIPGSGIMLEIIVCERVFGYPDHMVRIVDACIDRKSLE